MLANQMMTENSQGHVVHGEASDILKAKWARLIEGAGDDWSQRCLAQMFENEIGHLRNEVRQRGHITEATAAAAIPDYVKFVFPLIRRVWANLIANGLVSVQPMSAPIGGIFFWEYKYATTKGTITAGDNMIENLDRFYTSERVWHETIDTGDGVTVAFANPPLVTHLPIKPFDNFGQLGIEFASVAVTTGAALSIRDEGDPSVLVGDIGAASSVVLATGVYSITFSAAPANGAPVYANYWFSMEAASANVPEMEIDISLQPVQAWSRKLKALWSAEAADDLRAMLGMDIEGELVGGLASEVALEIDREIIQDIQVAAQAGTNTGTFDATVPPSRSPIEHYSGIITQFDKLATEIHTRTKRGPGNFIVCAPDVNTVVSALSRHGDFKGVFNDNPVQPATGYGTGGRPNFPLPNAPSGYGIYTSGTLQNRWRVIVDPWMDAGTAVVGLKGSSFVDSGYVYAPYVPLQVTSTFLDPANFQARKGLRTRYATKLTNTNFYGSLAVTNTP
jgi:hypothetical protein